MGSSLGEISPWRCEIEIFNRRGPAQISRTFFNERSCGGQQSFWLIYEVWSSRFENSEIMMLQIFRVRFRYRHFFQFFNFPFCRLYWIKLLSNSRDDSKRAGRAEDSRWGCGHVVRYNGVCGRSLGAGVFRVMYVFCRLWGTQVWSRICKNLVLRTWKICNCLFEIALFRSSKAAKTSESEMWVCSGCRAVFLSFDLQHLL